MDRARAELKMGASGEPVFGFAASSTFALYWPRRAGRASVSCNHQQSSNATVCRGGNGKNSKSRSEDRLQTLGEEACAEDGSLEGC